MIVLKFGGSSLASPDRVRQVMDVVLDAYRNRGARAVVCSAFGGATDLLLNMAYKAARRDESFREDLMAFRQRHELALAELVPGEVLFEARAKMDVAMQDLEDMLQGIYLIREATPRGLDYVASFGERSSCFIVAHALRHHVDAKYCDARNLVVTDDSFTKALVDFEKTNSNIVEAFNKDSRLQIVTGFLGRGSQQQTTTLGRGGSDYTAAIFAAALKAESCEIWTDVDGVMTADPRKVPGAFVVPAITFEEAMEMAHFGAKVIYPPTMAPVIQAQIPIRIKNTFRPEAPGTLVSNEVPERDDLACGITAIDPVALLQLKGSGMIGVAGTSNRLFGALANASINVVLISQASSEHAICIAVNPADADRAKAVVDAEFQREQYLNMLEPTMMTENMAVIAVVGEGLRRRPGVASRIFGPLGDSYINVAAIAQGASELNVSLVIERADLSKAMDVLHQAFFQHERQAHRVFLCGTGLIGKTLIQQINAQEDRKDLRPIVLHGISNSRKMLFSDEGIPIESAIAQLEQDGEPANLESFTDRIRRMKVNHKVFADCTASDLPGKFYENLLEHNVSVVTPNKKACTSDYGLFVRLNELGRRPGVAFFYEANAGAGLPVINTLMNLVGSGDRVRRIDAVLSGSLSYIFNTFDGTAGFSEIVRQARELGYTEPDPRDDLSGMDAARKILILARLAGHALHLEDLDVDSLVPASCANADNGDEFLNLLEKEDAHFAEIFQQAKAEGKVLRYLASFEDGKASVGLKAVGPDHPCYGLSNSENIISYTTDRYHSSPLVVKGPGAGPEVTSAQVLAEIRACP
jgi:aspartokinase/homoserine dehydrogenase 1